MLHCLPIIYSYIMHIWDVLQGNILSQILYHRERMWQYNNIISTRYFASIFRCEYSIFCIHFPMIISQFFLLHFLKLFTRSTLQIACEGKVKLLSHNWVFLAWDAAFFLPKVLVCQDPWFPQAIFRTHKTFTNWPHRKSFRMSFI